MQVRAEQTICAVSTAYGRAGLAVIRVSGPRALIIAGGIIPRLRKLQEERRIESHKAYLCTVVDSGAGADKVDQCVVTYFSAGRSFTGDEVVEISCHGSTYITGRILDLLIINGCSLAEPGEFTFRSFMNDRIDLVQAESVLALIESQSASSAKLALRQLDGHVSKSIESLESDLTWCLAHIEASIDFSSEGIEVIKDSVLLKKLREIQERLSSLLSGYKSGRLVRDGIKLVLVGSPNVGKSSLMNLLVQDERAIVTEVPGTTRDVIQAETVFNGVKFFISDTAGLRETSDVVERIGVGRSQEEARRADAVLLVLSSEYFFSGNRDFSQLLELAKSFSGSRLIWLVNKGDLFPNYNKSFFVDKLKGLGILSPGEDLLLTSCLQQGYNLDSELNNRIDHSVERSLNPRGQILAAALQSLGDLSFLNEAVISSTRQFEGVQYSLEMLRSSIEDLELGIGSEFVAMHLKEALVSLQRLLGRVYDDQILDKVFKEFCLGK